MKISSRTLCVLLCGLLAAPQTVFAPPAPTWWAERGALDSTKTADDYAVANIGQLKHIASKAAEELDAHLPGGAGPAIHLMLAEWYAPNPPAGVIRDDFAAVTLGQLKFVAKPFYDRLIPVGYSYPWSGPDDDTALAVLGQLKHVFSFDLLRDTDGDGWRDVTDPTPNNPDSDGDGVSDGDEGTGDTDGDGVPDYLDSDSDNDGANDREDKFPKDDRRSDYIPVKYYGVIDLSEGVTPPLAKPPGVTLADHIAIDDEGRVAFQTYHAGQTSPEIRILRWEDGSIVQDRRYWLSREEFFLSFDSRLTTDYHFNLSNWPECSDWIVHETRVPVAVNTDGSFAGRVDGWVGAFFGIDYLTGYSRYGFAIDRYEQQRLLLPDHPETEFGEGYTGSAAYLARADGLNFGYVDVNVTPGSPNSGLKRILAVNDGVRPQDPPGAFSLPTSSDGKYVATGPENRTIWNSVTNSVAATVPAGCDAWAVNKEGYAVGRLYQTDEEGYELGFLWDGAVRHTFHDVLPGKFKKQLRSAVPFLITNKDPETYEVLIYFSAESLEGSAESPEWVSRSMVMIRPPTGEPEIDVMDSATPKTETAFLGRSATANRHGELVHVKGDVPQLVFPYEFQAVNINRGFDLPIAGDKPITGTSDDLKREWWTSVARTATSTLRQNQNVKTVFNDGKTKPGEFGVEAVSVDETADLITVGSNGALANGQVLTITGKADNKEVISRAQVLVKPRKGTELRGNPLMALDVDVMPEWVIPVAVWYIKDNVPAANNPMAPVPPQFRKGAQIVAKLTELFRPACVKFVLQSEQELEIDADTTGEPNGQPDGAILIGKFSVENDALDKAHLPLPGKINILIASRYSGAAELGNTPWTPDRDRCFIPTKIFEGGAPSNYNLDDFFQTCAHEVGHVLFLSTREDRKQIPAERPYHDGGPFPWQDYYRDGTKVPPEKRKDKSSAEIAMRLQHGLMSTRSPSGMWDWIRNEDWKEANKRAENFAKP